MHGKFLVDVNLPKYFSFFNSEDYIFVADIDLSMTDEDIWNYTLDNNLIILTKDSDCYHKCLKEINKPKIVYFRLGNLTLHGLYKYFEANWNQILVCLEKHNLIIADIDSFMALL